MSVSSTPHCFFCFKGFPVYPFTSPNARDAMAGDIIGKFLVVFSPHFTVFLRVAIFYCFSGACSFMEIYVVFATVGIFLSETLCCCQKFIILSCLY